MIRVLVIASALMLGGCATKPSGGFCDIARPILVTPATAEAMSPQERLDALAHNRTGRSQCGWRR